MTQWFPLPITFSPKAPKLDFTDNTHRTDCQFVISNLLSKTDIHWGSEEMGVQYYYSDCDSFHTLIVFVVCVCSKVLFKEPEPFGY